MRAEIVDELWAHPPHLPAWFASPCDWPAEPVGRSAAGSNAPIFGVHQGGTLFLRPGWVACSNFPVLGNSGAGKAPGKSRSALGAGERAMRGGLCRPRDSDWVRPVALPVLSHRLAVVTEAQDTARLRAVCDFVWREGRPSTSRVELAKGDQAAEPRYRSRNRHHLSHRVLAKRVNSPTVRSHHLVARPQCIAARDRLENRGASTAAPAS